MVVLLNGEQLIVMLEEIIWIYYQPLAGLNRLPFVKNRGFRRVVFSCLLSRKRYSKNIFSNEAGWMETGESYDNHHSKSNSQM